MNRYLVKMRNPKKDRVETYETSARNEHELQKSLELWTDVAGYEIISWEEIEADELVEAFRREALEIYKEFY